MQVGKLEVSLPYRSAAQWAPALVTGRMHQMVAWGLPEEAVERLLLSLVDGRLSERDIRDAAFSLIEKASGWEWWAAVRLVYYSEDASVLGRLVLAGVRPHEVSLAEWCAAVYAIFTKDAKHEDQFKFDALLHAPPPGYEDAWDDGTDFDQMVQAARSMPGMS